MTYPRDSAVRDRQVGGVGITHSAVGGHECRRVDEGLDGVAQNLQEGVMGAGECRRGGPACRRRARRGPAHVQQLQRRPRQDARSPPTELHEEVLYTHAQIDQLHFFIHFFFYKKTIAWPQDRMLLNDDEAHDVDVMLLPSNSLFTLALPKPKF